MMKTLSEVITETFSDSAFRQELLDDHRSALSSRKYELSNDDMQKLHDFMTHVQVATPATILEVFSGIATGSTFPIPPSWQPVIPRNVNIIDIDFDPSDMGSVT